MWYKDRDFSEVKASNADIIAVIENPKQLDRVINEYNDMMWRADHYRRFLTQIVNLGYQSTNTSQEELLRLLDETRDLAKQGLDYK